MGAVETVRWLRDCLREDRARRGGRDFTSAQVELRRFMQGTETLATDDLPSEVVGVSYGEALSHKMGAYGRRRESVYGTLFLTGRWLNKSWCAPVLLYPARVSKEGVGELVLAQWKLNPVLRDELDLDEQFYGGGIGLMTDRPWESDQGALVLETCAGERDRNGVNAVEIDRLIEVLTELLEEG